MEPGHTTQDIDGDCFVDSYLQYRKEGLRKGVIDSSGACLQDQTAVRRAPSGCETG